MVTRFTRVWIETMKFQVCMLSKRSPASRGCGLKLSLHLSAWVHRVTRFTRVWIETLGMKRPTDLHKVTRFTRVWIETMRQTTIQGSSRSPASRGCGLKQRVKR